MVVKFRVLPPVTTPEIKSTVSQDGSVVVSKLKNAFGTLDELRVTEIDTGVVEPLTKASVGVVLEEINGVMGRI